MFREHLFMYKEIKGKGTYRSDSVIYRSLIFSLTRDKKNSLRDNCRAKWFCTNNYR